MEAPQAELPAREAAVATLAMDSQANAVAEQLEELATLQESSGNENEAPLQQQETVPTPAPAKPRRVSESGLPPARPTQRRSSTSGTPDAKGFKSPQTTPRGRIIPRETRSSQLRKSTSGVDSSSLRSAGSLGKEGTPGAAGFELARLRDDLRAEQRERDRLAEEVATQKHLLAAKDRALAKATADAESLSARLLTAESNLANKARELRDAEAAGQRARSERQELERQADRLNRKLLAQPQGTGFSEAVAEMDAAAGALRRDNARLADEAKALAGLVRAKDRELDRMAAEVEAARGIVAQNGELENYVRDLRRQLAEAGEERATLLGVQRQRREDYARLEEAAAAGRQELADARGELAACQARLKDAEARAATLARELELREGELRRVAGVASRAVHREAAAIKEDGTVPFSQHKQEVGHLRGEIARLKEKLALADKSAAATQLQVRALYGRIDVLEGRYKVSPRSAGKVGGSPGLASPRPAAEHAAA